MPKKNFLKSETIQGLIGLAITLIVPEIYNWAQTITWEDIRTADSIPIKAVLIVVAGGVTLHGRLRHGDLTFGRPDAPDPAISKLELYESIFKRAPSLPDPYADANINEDDWVENDDLGDDTP